MSVMTTVYQEMLDKSWCQFTFPDADEKSWDLEDKSILVTEYGTSPESVLCIDVQESDVSNSTNRTAK